MLYQFPAQNRSIRYLDISAGVIYWKLCMIIGYHNETKLKHTMDFKKKKKRDLFFNFLFKLLHMNLDLA